MLFLPYLFYNVNQLDLRQFISITILCCILTGMFSSPSDNIPVTCKFVAIPNVFLIKLLYSANAINNSFSVLVYSS